MTKSKNNFRSDIQGVRAVAVLLVLIYHVFPNLVPGGYVGVDVFFVISGFLICGHILNEAEKAGQFSILKFYGRRIRRLLPAASTVLIFIATGTYFLLPPTRWIDTTSEMFASILYFENHYLYQQSVDYLTADKPPSPAQHFWSLSVEEQFYIFWPFVMVVILAVCRWSKLSIRTAALTILTMIFGISLYYSRVLSNADPGPAYFHTFTRVWEIAIGGILAAISPISRLSGTQQRSAAWLGLAMILYSAFSFNKLTIFPGLAALVPTLGTALILWGGIGLERQHQNFVQKILSTKPLLFIGGISYSLYLWHWPLIMFARDGLQLELNLAPGIGLIILSIAVAWISKIFVEDPFRTSKRRDQIGLTFVIGAMLMMAPLLMAGLLAIQTPKSDQLVIPKSFPGAHALVKPEYFSTDVDSGFIPSLENARNDIASVYKDKCHVARPDIELTPCIYVPELNEDGKRYMLKVDTLPDEYKNSVIMLVGDSHAAQWLPALKIIALDQNWAIITHTKSSCAFIDATLGRTPYTECRRWGNDVLEDVFEQKPVFIVTSMVTNHFVAGSTSTAENRKNLAKGLSSYWTKLSQNKTPVFAINGTPRFQNQVPDCVSQNPANWAACNLSRSDAMQHGGVTKMATELSSNAFFIDMTDLLCTADVCPVIVGDILVYRDQHHITATYVRTMAPYLWEKILKQR